MESEMESAMEKNLSPLKALFKYSGLWAFNLKHDNVKIRIFSNINGLINILVYSLVCICEIVYMITSWPNLSEVTAVIATLLSANLTLLKLSILYLKSNSIMDTVRTVLMTDFSRNIPIIKNVVAMDESINNESMIKLRNYIKTSMHNKLKECKYIYILNAFFVIITLIGYGCLPAAKMLYYGSTHTEEGIMYTPFRATVPFDQTTEPGYEIVYLLQLWASVLTIAGYTGMDTFICWHLIMIKRQFEIIAHLMKNLEEYAIGSLNRIKIIKRNNFDTDTMEECYDEEIEKKANDLLVQCIEHYDRLMGLLEKINSVFGVVIFSQMLSSSALLCVVFFKYKTDVKERSTYFTYIGAASCQLFLYCWFGQAIINITSDLSENVYEIPWYKFSTKIQKSIIMLQRQYQRPITITGLGFTTISLPSFTSILSTAMSYLALLNSFLEEK